MEEDWLTECIAESREPMNRAYGAFFSALVMGGCPCEDAQKKAIAAVEYYFSVHDYHPPVNFDSVDDLFAAIEQKPES